MGLIGEPFEIETTSKFDKATLTYVIDKSKLGDTEFDNLLFLWYDEENDNFVELDTNQKASIFQMHCLTVIRERNSITFWVKRKLNGFTIKEKYKEMFF